ncbi:hypothetical protein DVW02_06415 [Clostridium botulinum]|nr:hypothetical protein [Clostridium botulinum]
MPNILIEERKIENLEFIGENYLRDTVDQTEKRKKELLESYDEFQIRKLNFLNEVYDNYKTKHSYFNSYNNHINNFEQNFNKDLMYFSKLEISRIISSFTFLSESTQKTILTFCTQYCKYYKEIGKITGNPCEGLSYNKSIKNSKKIQKHRLYSKAEILKIIKKASENTNPNFLKPLVLYRMGIKGKEAIYIRSLKWKDININNNEITIHNQDETKTKIIKIDKWAMDILIKLHELGSEKTKCTDNIEFGNLKIVEPERYVLEGRSEGILKYNTINNWMNRISKWADVMRICPEDLIFTRQMELLLRRRKHIRLTNDDLQEVLSESTLEDMSLSTVTILKNRYKDLTNDEIFRSINNLKDDIATTIKLRKEIITMGDVEGEYRQIIKKLGFDAEEDDTILSNPEVEQKRVN